MEGVSTTELPRIEAPAGIDRENERLQNLAEEAFEEIADYLAENRERAADMVEVVKSVEDVLAVENTRSLQVRAKPFENPRVTLWLKDCPVWANVAWSETIYPHGINAYNRDVTVTFDVRPF